MLVELVQTTTRDGVRLDGAYQTPSISGTPRVPVDGFCLVHGTGGSFYTSALFESLARRFLDLGCSVLRVNTRGHDLMSTAATTQGGRRQGAAYEVVSDCTHDLHAWVHWCSQRGLSRVGLVGHSLGAVKCLYTLAEEPQLRVVCLLAVSPPCLSHARFRASDQAVEFMQTYTQAEEHVRQGKPDTLMEVRLPLPFVITAGGYVEKYGPDERYNILQFANRVPCPTLITLGEQEVTRNMAFQGLPEELQQLANKPEHLQVVTIPGADHFYSTTQQALADQLESWLRVL